jgi:hypothetical protein
MGRGPSATSRSNRVHDEATHNFVEGERIRCIRLDKLRDVGIDFTIPFRKQYSIRLYSSIPVFCQYGRLDSAQPNLALMTAPTFG